MVTIYHSIITYWITNDILIHVEAGGHSIWLLLPLSELLTLQLRHHNHRLCDWVGLSGSALNSCFSSFTNVGFGFIYRDLVVNHSFCNAFYIYSINLCILDLYIHIFEFVIHFLKLLLYFLCFDKVNVRFLY